MQSSTSLKHDIPTPTRPARPTKKPKTDKTAVTLPTSANNSKSARLDNLEETLGAISKKLDRVVAMLEEQKAHAQQNDEKNAETVRKVQEIYIKITTMYSAVQNNNNALIAFFNAQMQENAVIKSQLNTLHNLLSNTPARLSTPLYPAPLAPPVLFPPQGVRGGYMVSQTTSVFGPQTPAASAAPNFP